MAFFDTVKTSVTNAIDSVTGATQNLIEKNRANAQLNRLRAVMKAECEMINRAYITLGKNYYENKVNGNSEGCADEEELFAVIEQSKRNIKKARDRYRQVMEAQSMDSISSYDISELEDITVSCSNEDEYESSPFTKEEKTAEEVVDEVIEKVKKKAEAMADEAEEAEEAEETTEVADETELF